jgi:predicted nucleotidyltransferase
MTATSGTRASLGFSNLRPAMAGPIYGLLLYGSQARGTSKSTSDVDLLQLSERPGPTVHVGRLSISRYDKDSLTDLMTRGSIFGRHLRVEGQVLFDPSGDLSRILECYQAPASYEPARSMIRTIASALKLPHPVAFETGVHRAAAYCARTALYIDSIESGDEHYDADRLAEDRGFKGFGEWRRNPSAAATSRLLDVAMMVTEGSKLDLQAPDFESALVELSTTFPTAANFLATLGDVDTEIAYSTLTLPFA